MNALIAWSIRHRLIVAILTILGLISGFAMVTQAPFDVFPEFVPPSVTIQTEAPGLTPEQVEEIVTRPVESAVNGAPGLSSLRSESIPGLSVVTLTFDEGADPYLVRQGVSEQVSSLAGQLPGNVGQPKLSPLTSSTMDLLKVGLVSDSIDAFELRDTADWLIKPRILSVPGIARVNTFGGAVRQIQIQPHLDRLTALGLNLTDVLNAGRSALVLHGAGFIDTAAQRILIETPVPTTDPVALSQTVVTVKDGVPIVLGDIADVTIAPAVMMGDALIQDRPGVLLTISGQFGANTLTVTHALEATLAELKPALEARGITLYPELHRPANFIERALVNFEHSLAIGAVLILIFLYAFLRSWRAALISFLTIPASLMAAILVLSVAGESLNTMTLGGFAVALGILVDDAIIDIENILRRQREAGLKGGVVDRSAITESASIEIRGSMVFGTLVILISLLPILLMEGVQGRFVGPLALAFCLAVIASLMTALTITPAFAALILRASDAETEPAWILALKKLQLKVLDWVRHFWGYLFFAIALAFLCAVAGLFRLPTEFMPQFREGHFVAQVTTNNASISFAEMMRIGQHINREILKLPFIATVEDQAGRAEAGEDTWGPNRSELHIELKPGLEQSEEQAQEQIREVLEEIPGIQNEVLTFLGDRISESLTGETSQAVIVISGPYLDSIEQTATDIGQAIQGIPGLADLRVPEITGTPALSIRMDPARLAAYGINHEQAVATVETAFAGTLLGQTFTGNRVVDVVAILSPVDRNNMETLQGLMIAGNNLQVPLHNIADISLVQDRAVIQHVGSERRVAVTFNAADRPLSDIMSEVQARVAEQVKIPQDVYVSYTGQAQAAEAAQIRLAVMSAASIIMIVLIMTLAFRRKQFAFLTLVNVHFCLIGSMIAIVMTGVGLTLGSLVGLIAVFGIGARNTIMFLAYLERLMDIEGLPWSRETLRRAISGRFVPMLMTALIAALGLVPMALGIGHAGYEIEAPIAIAVLGGLASATLLNLLFLPELVWRISSGSSSEITGVQ